MTDRTKVDISSNMTICCNNCLNDGDSLDWFSSCNMCQVTNGKYYYFLGLKEDKRCKKGYRVIKSAESELKDTAITVEDLLGVGGSRAGEILKEMIKKSLIYKHGSGPSTKYSKN